MIAELPIALRRFQADDVLPLYEAAHESIADIYPWMPWCHPGYTVDDSRSWVLSRLEAWGKPDYDFVIVAQGTDRFLGAVGLNQINRVIPTTMLSCSHCFRSIWATIRCWCKSCPAFFDNSPC